LQQVGSLLPHQPAELPSNGVLSGFTPEEHFAWQAAKYRRIRPLLGRSNTPINKTHNISQLFRDVRLPG
jgi:hypothetical protein